MPEKTVRGCLLRSGRYHSTKSVPLIQPLSGVAPSFGAEQATGQHAKDMEEAVGQMFAGPSWCAPAKTLFPNPGGALCPSSDSNKQRCTDTARNCGTARPGSPGSYRPGWQAGAQASRSLQAGSSMVCSEAIIRRTGYCCHPLTAAPCFGLLHRGSAAASRRADELCKKTRDPPHF